MTAGEADGDSWFWPASAPSFPVCAARFALDCEIAGTTGGATEAVGKVAARCIERPKESAEGVTAGDAGGGTELWLVSAPVFPVCAVRFAFDRGTAGTAGRFAVTVEEAASIASSGQRKLLEARQPARPARALSFGWCRLRCFRFAQRVRVRPRNRGNSWQDRRSRRRCCLKLHRAAKGHF